MPMAKLKICVSNVRFILEKPSIFHADGEDIKLKTDLKFHLYVNTIPCGDARVFSLKGCKEFKKT